MSPLSELASRVLRFYPRVFFACHVRHEPDPRARRAVTPREAEILAHLDERTPVNLAALARHMGVTPSTMCLHVERLVRKGLARRDPSPRDRRQVELRLTRKGAEWTAAQSVLDPGRVEALLSRLAPEERERAVAGLALLAEAADEMRRAERAAAREGAG